MGEEDQILRTLRMEVDAPASPRLVLETVELLAKAVEALPTELDDDAVTLVVQNFGLAAELRGRSFTGADAVETVSQIITDPERMEAEHPELRAACTVVRDLLRPLQPLMPRFASVEGPYVPLDYVGPARAVEDEESERGTSTVEAEILSFGKRHPRGPDFIRIQSPWGIKWVRVTHELKDRCKALASTGRIVQITMDGCWIRRKRGVEFRPEKVVSIDESVEIMTGRDFLHAAKASGLFTAETLDGIREDLKRARH